jgi:hypothetical protein
MLIAQNDKLFKKSYWGFIRLLRGIVLSLNKVLEIDIEAVKA